MKKRSSIQKAIDIFRKAGGTLKMSEAVRLGIHRRDLYRLRDTDQLEVLDRGLFRLKELPDPSLPDFIHIAKKIPQGVICLISALAFHEITTQIPHFVYVALPKHAHKPVIDYPPTRFFWYSDKLLTSGVDRQCIDGCSIKIFDREKTLVDCIKFRNKIGIDIVLEALKMYWKRPDVNLDRLMKLAGMFRVNKILQPMMEAIVSD